MTKNSIKPRLSSKKLKQKPKPQIENITSLLPPNLQNFKLKLLSGESFVEYN